MTEKNIKEKLDKKKLEMTLTELQIGALAIKKAFKERLYENGQDGMDAYHAIGKKYGTSALLAYAGAVALGKPPKLNNHLIKNRCRESAGITTLEFWQDVDAVTVLYDLLVKNGFYAKKTASAS